MSAENLGAEKVCRICFRSSKDDTTAQWVNPCKCDGDRKWVHQYCLRLWVREKRTEPFGEVKCPVCKTTYLIKYPRVPIWMLTLQTFDRIVDSLFGQFLIGTVFITAAPSIYDSLRVLLCLEPRVAETALASQHVLYSVKANDIIIGLAFGSFCFLSVALMKLENEIVFHLADNKRGFSHNQIVSNGVRYLSAVLCLPVMPKIVGSFVDSPVRASLIGIGLLFTVNTFIGVFFKYQKLRCSRQVEMILDYEENVQN